MCRRVPFQRNRRVNTFPQKKHPNLLVHLGFFKDEQRDVLADIIMVSCPVGLLHELECTEDCRYGLASSRDDLLVLSGIVDDIPAGEYSVPGCAHVEPYLNKS